MSTVTLELPDTVATQLTTPEGMARAQAAVVAAFNEEETAADAWRKFQKVRAREKRDRLVEHIRAIRVAREQTVSEQNA